LYNILKITGSNLGPLNFSETTVRSYLKPNKSCKGYTIMMG